MRIVNGRDELVDHLAGLMASRLLDPLEILLEAELADVRKRVTTLAGTLADRLLGVDEQLAAYTAIRLVSSLYSGDEPFRPVAGWWATPLGQVVARLVGYPGAESLSYAEAGAMLGISRQGVHDLITRGKLQRHAAGGVTNASVQSRLKSRAAAAPRARQEETK
ncbi:hypothetical protein AB0J83_39170 [Actinoplanes sp. NPDC049596]|uniref:hypothetical protein n=1 Tax=unclassified Actinoplanes TaxID=2626549 RepID=UPI0034422D04